MIFYVYIFAAEVWTVQETLQAGKFYQKVFQETAVLGLCVLMFVCPVGTWAGKGSRQAKSLMDIWLSVLNFHSCNLWDSCLSSYSTPFLTGNFLVESWCMYAAYTMYFNWCMSTACLPCVKVTLLHTCCRILWSLEHISDTHLDTNDTQLITQCLGQWGD